MIGDERFIPADQSASPLGAGVDPASDALMSALSQIRAIQQQPLIATDPLSQLGSGLQGIAAGYRGEVNPAVKEALAVRQQQLSGGLGQAHLGLAIAGLGLHARSEQRLEQNERTKFTLEMSNKLMASDNPDQQKLGTQFFAGAMRDLGIPVDPAALTDLGRKPLKPDEVNAIGKMLLSGAPVQSVASIFGRDPKTVQLLAQMPDSPDLRAAIGMKSLAQLQKEETESGKSQFDMLKAQRDWQSPELTKEVLAQGKLMDPVKGYFGLDSTQQAEAVKRAEYKRLSDQNQHFDYTQQALMDKPLPPNQKAAFVDPRTYKTPSGPLTQRSADANGLVMVEDPATRRALPALRTLGETVNRVTNIIERHPEYWPPTSVGPTGQANWMANQANIQIGRGKMAAQSGIDPDLAAIKSSMADIVKLATTAGASSRFSTYMAQLEKESAGWDTPGTRESKLMQFRTTLQRINGQLTAIGLDPLPTVVTVNGKRVEVPGGG